MGMRRTIIGMAAVGALVLAACGDDDADAEANDAAGEETSTTAADAPDGFSFTDDLGDTVTLQVPDVVVGPSSVAGSLWEYGVDLDGVYGPLGTAEQPDPQLGLADPDSFTSLGEQWGEINLEQLHALEPDLFVNAMWGGREGLESHPQWSQLVDVAPHVNIEVVDTDFATIPERFAALAVALGADEAEVAEARSEYDASVERLRTVLAERPEISVSFVSASADLIYLGVVEGYTDLQFFDQLGMNIHQQPPSEDLEIGGVVYWTELSWENADMASADVVFVDTRTYSDVNAILDEAPTWQALPARQAGQIGGWDVEPGYGYRNLARLFGDMADTIENAEDVVS